MTLHLNLSRRWVHHFNERTAHVGNDYILIEKIRQELAGAFPHRIETIVKDGEKIGSEYLFADGSRFGSYNDQPGKIIFGSVLSAR